MWRAIMLMRGTNVFESRMTLDVNYLFDWERPDF